MNILLFGPPGAGKGTQSEFLVTRDGFSHVSTGDVFRAAIKNGTALGLEAKGYVEKGLLVPDRVTIGLVREVLGSSSSERIVLDGFPRTVDQAEALESLTLEIGRPIGRAFFLEVPHSLLLDRLTGRRTCKECGAVYHVKSRPSQKSGVCDACGGMLIQRNDDTEAVISNRLVAYSENAEKLKLFFRNKNKMVVIDGTKAVEDVYKEIRSFLG